MFLSRPGEATGVVAAEHEQRRVVGVGVGREDGGRALRVLRLALTLTARADRVQQHHRRAIRALRHRRHQWRLPHTITVTNTSVRSITIHIMTYIPP